MAVASCVATALERRRPLPVDRIIPDPLLTSTHAITIDAPPDQVWPRIAQVGAGRAGWYTAFVVASVDPPRDLVLTVPDGHGGNAVGWERVLDPLADGRTRLIVRGRAGSNWLDLARAQPPAGHRRTLIERAYALLAHLRDRCSSASHPSATASWQRGTCAASGDAARRLDNEQTSTAGADSCSPVGFSRPPCTSR